MKKITLTLSLAMFGFLGISKAQTAQKDLSIYGNSKIYAFHNQASIWPIIVNHSSSDYKDITYRVTFVAGDGTVISYRDITYFNFIGPHVSKKVGLHNKSGEEYIDRPRDTKSIRLSIVSAKRLD